LQQGRTESIYAFGTPLQIQKKDDFKEPDQKYEETDQQIEILKFSKNRKRIKNNEETDLKI